MRTLKDDKKNFINELKHLNTIKERVQSEELLLNSEENFHAFFETIDEMIFIINKKGIVFHTNVAVLRKLGYTQKELYKMNVVDILADEKKFKSENIFSEMIAGKRSSCFVSLITKNGTIIPTETLVWFGKWDGKDCVFGVSKDLTIQQAAFDKFYKMFNNNPALMAVINIADKKFIDVNNAFLNKLGFTREEILGKTSKELKLFIENDKLTEVVNLLPKEEKIKNIELKIRKKNGQIMDGLFSSEIIDNQIEKSFLTVVTDITEQKQVEEELHRQIQMQEILMNIASKYINISLDKVDKTMQQSLKELGTFVKSDRAYVFEYDWNKNICTNTYEWCGEGITPQIQELQEISIDLLSQWAKHHKRGFTMYVADVLALPENDSLRQILEPQEIKSLIAIPMINKNECVGFVGFDSVKKYYKYSNIEKNLLTVFANMLINIKIRNNLEQNIIEASTQAEAANEAKSQFLAKMSHEIRTPMNGIFGFLELLQTSNLSSEQKEYIREAKSASTILLNLINDILDFSKIEAGKLKIEMISFDLRTLVEDAVSMLSPKAVAKNLYLQVIIKESVPKEVIGDPSRIRQIITNLVSNAVKFTENGGIFITVDSIEKENQMVMIKFEVKDTGIGISKDIIKNLFQSFNQADVSTTRKYGGTGLGLAISKELVKMMGGEISVKSILGKGSIFSFNIIFKIGSKLVDEKTENRTISIEETQILTNQISKEIEYKMKPKILLAEDSEMNRKIIIKILQSHDMTCDIAINGRDAYLMIQQKDYDIVFMDCQMPVMDGYESTMKIREYEGNQKHTTIIAMTANTMQGDREKCISAGMDDYISKPIDFKNMFSLIESNTKQENKITKINNTTKQIELIDNHIEEFMENTGFNKEEAKEMFEEYLNYLPGILSDIDKSIEETDFKKTAKLSHQLKGSSGNLRIRSIHQLATKLNEASKNQAEKECKIFFREIQKLI